MEKHISTHVHTKTNGVEASWAKHTRYAGALLINKERWGGREFQMNCQQGRGGGLISFSGEQAGGEC